MNLTNNITSNCTRGVDTGAAAALAAFFTWGLLPVYWKLLAHLPPLLILIQRMFWSFVLLALLLMAQRRLKDAFLLLKNRRICLTVLLCSVLLGFNWLLFIVAINSNMIVQVSLAYFMVPILNMLTGILLFKEKLVKAQWLALVLVVCGVGVQVIFGDVLDN